VLERREGGSRPESKGPGGGKFISDLEDSLVLTRKEDQGNVSAGGKQKKRDGEKNRWY